MLGSARDGRRFLDVCLILAVIFLNVLVALEVLIHVAIFLVGILLVALVIFMVVQQMEADHILVNFQLVLVAALMLSSLLLLGGRVYLCVKTGSDDSLIILNILDFIFFGDSFTIRCAQDISADKRESLSNLGVRLINEFSLFSIWDRLSHPHSSSCFDGFLDFSELF